MHAIPNPGERLGRFELLEILGSGSAGVVYRAHDTALGEEICVKVLHPSVASHPEVLQRFRREVLLARRVTHRGVCRLFDLHEEDGVTFVTMELVRGQTLRDVIQGRGALRLVEALRTVRSICEGLAAAHAEGIVHRDLKPRNIILRDDGSACILDFGVATARDVAQLTTPGMPLGTRHYIPPEVWEGEPADALGDIFAMGVILYNCVTGRMPFRPSSKTGFGPVVFELPPPLGELEPGFPAAIDALIRRGLAFDRSQRFPDAGAMASALAGYEPVAQSWQPTSGVWEQETSVGVIASEFEKRVPVGTRKIAVSATADTTVAPAPQSPSLEAAHFGVATSGAAVPLGDATLRIDMRQALDGEPSVTAPGGAPPSDSNGGLDEETLPSGTDPGASPPPAEAGFFAADQVSAEGMVEVTDPQAPGDIPRTGMWDNPHSIIIGNAVGAPIEANPTFRDTRLERLTQIVRAPVEAVAGPSRVPLLIGAFLVVLGAGAGAFALFVVDDSQGAAVDDTAGDDPALTGADDGADLDPTEPSAAGDDVPQPADTGADAELPAAAAGGGPDAGAVAVDAGPTPAPSAVAVATEPEPAAPAVAKPTRSHKKRRASRHSRVRKKDPPKPDPPKVDPAKKAYESAKASAVRARKKAGLLAGDVPIADKMLRDARQAAKAKRYADAQALAERADAAYAATDISKSFVQSKLVRLNRAFDKAPPERQAPATPLMKRVLTELGRGDAATANRTLNEAFRVLRR